MKSEKKKKLKEEKDNYTKIIHTRIYIVIKMDIKSKHN